jgi:CheY-like chemotaxis protein
MSESSARHHRPKRVGTLIYPPVWYLNLVQLRLRAVEERGASNPPKVPGVCHGGFEVVHTDGAEDTQLSALALEIIRPICLQHRPSAEQAYILGLNVLEVRQYLKETFSEIGLQASAATLIIEDEAAVALDIARIVRHTGHRVCGTATRLDQALAIAARVQPELVLADVQLRDGPEAGLAAVREIAQLADTAAVYVTAYPERVRDSRPAPIVVSKPFVANEVSAAIWRALYRRCQSAAAAA